MNKIDMNDLMGENEIYLPSGKTSRKYVYKEDIEKIFNSVKFNQKSYENWKKKHYELSICLMNNKKELDFYLNLIERYIYCIMYNFLGYPDIYDLEQNFFNRKDLQKISNYYPKYEHKLLRYYLFKKVYLKFEKKLIECWDSIGN